MSNVITVELTNRQTQKVSTIWIEFEGEANRMAAITRACTAFVLETGKEFIPEDYDIVTRDGVGHSVDFRSVH